MILFKTYVFLRYVKMLSSKLKYARFDTQARILRGFTIDIGTWWRRSWWSIGHFIRTSRWDFYCIQIHIELIGDDLGDFDI